jgi:hypothetical protein
MNRAQKLVLWGAVCLILGALLPWGRVESILLGMAVPVYGISGNGIYSGAIGVLLLIAAIAYRGKPGRVFSRAASGFAALAGLIIISALVNLVEAAGASSGVITRPGIGIFISLLGALLCFVGGLVKLPEIDTTPQPTQDRSPHAPKSEPPTGPQ